MELFIYLFFGHFFGDYWLQNSWMAYHKKARLMPCITHCVVYTATVCLFLLMSPHVGGIDKTFYEVAMWIFATHWFIDRYEIVGWWFNLMSIRSWNNFEGGLEDTPRMYDCVITSFGAIVYTVADNILHLFLMWLVVKYYYGV